MISSLVTELDDTLTQAGRLHQSLEIYFGAVIVFYDKITFSDLIPLSIRAAGAWLSASYVQAMMPA